MYYPTSYWFTKEGIEEYLKEKQKEYSVTSKLLNSYKLTIVDSNLGSKSEFPIEYEIEVAKKYNIITEIINNNSKCERDSLGYEDLEGLSKYWKNIQAIDPDKALWPCTARGIYDHAVWVANREEKSLEGKTALIIGRSDLVGRPIAQMFERLQNMTVIQCHSYTPYEEITSLLWHADIVVCDMNKPNFLTGSRFNFGTYIYDAGLNPTENGFVGDISSVDSEYITPVPDGVGRLTVHALMHNTIDWYLNKEYYETHYGKS